MVILRITKIKMTSFKPTGVVDERKVEGIYCHTINIASF